MGTERNVYYLNEYNVDKIVDLLMEDENIDAELRCIDEIKAVDYVNAPTVFFCKPEYLKAWMKLKNSEHNMIITYSTERTQ